MPIKKYEDTRRLPRLGKLRKGAAKKGNKPGENLTYWRFTSNRPKIEAAFLEAYGPEPTELLVHLPHRTADENFTYWMEQWDAGSMIRRCNGQEIVQWRDEEGFFSFQRKPCEREVCGCVETGRLEVILPELLPFGYVGVVMMETHGKNDIPFILGALEDAEEKFASPQSGMRSIQFLLRREMVSISTPGWKDDPPGKRRRRDDPVVRIVPMAEYVQRYIERMRGEFLGVEGGEEVAALPCPEPEEEVVGAAEFIAEVRVELDELVTEAEELGAVVTALPDPKDVALPSVQDVAENKDLEAMNWGDFSVEVVKRFSYKDADEVSEVLTQKLGPTWGKFKKSYLWVVLGMGQEEQGD